MLDLSNASLRPRLPQAKSKPRRAKTLPHFKAKKEPQMRREVEHYNIYL